MSDEHIVSETTLGSSNYFSRYGRGVVDSLKGVGTGFVMLIIGFAILYFSVGMKENSKVVATLPLTPAEQITATQTGLVKITGKPVIAAPIIAPRTTQQVIYYIDTVEEYRKVEEKTTSTRTVQKDGQDVQQEVETSNWVEKWVTASEATKWANFKLGNVNVEGLSSSPSFNENQLFTETKDIPPVANAAAAVPSITTINGQSLNAYPATKIRETVMGVTPDQQLIVIGEVNSGTIRSGDPFVVSNKTDAEILASMQKAESFKFWGAKIGAWLFIALGLMGILGPIFAILNIIPGVGGFFSGIGFFISAIISAVIVLIGSLVIAYWYVFVALLIILIIAALVIKMRKK